MAKDGLDLGSLVKWGLLLGGGYYLYQTYVSSSSSTTTSPSSTGSLSLADLTTAIKNALAGSGSPSSSTAPPPAAPTGPTTITALRAAIQKPAGLTDQSINNGYSLSMDGWNFYRNNVQPPALTAEQFGQVVAALPAGVDRSLVTVDQFLAALKASGVVSGLSGLGAVSIAVPMLVNVNGRRGVVWASHNVGSAGPSGLHGLDHPKPNYRRAG